MPEVSSATPVNRRYRAAGPTYLEVLEIELHVTLRDRREAFKNLQLSPLAREKLRGEKPVPPTPVVEL